MSSGAEKRWTNGGATTDDTAKHYLVMELTMAFEAAQGWVLTPDDEKQLDELLDPETIKSLRCRFRCGAALSISSEPGPYTIFSGPSWTPEDRDNVNESMEYLNSQERLRYSINQYRCANRKALEEKLLQFPSGSTLAFSSDDFTERDRDELMEISNLLQKHGYKVNNQQNWTFLTDNSSH